jgi:hypothetical protein
MDALQRQMAQLQVAQGAFGIPAAAMSLNPTVSGVMSIPPPLRVCVDGVPFTYQLTEEDLLTVFRRFGDVVHVAVHPSGNIGVVQFSLWPPTMHALTLHQKELQGLSGSSLLVEIMSPEDVQQFYAPASSHTTTLPSSPSGGFGGFAEAAGADADNGDFDKSGRPARKYTCRFEVGARQDGQKTISNYKVASRMIHFIAVPIWKALPNVKTRVRGRGSGFKEGPRKVEANEPLQLCISSPSERDYQQALTMAEEGLTQIQNEYWSQTQVALLVQKFEMPIFTRQERRKSGRTRGKGTRKGQPDQDGDAAEAGEDNLDEA